MVNLIARILQLFAPDNQSETLHVYRCGKCGKASPIESRCWVRITDAEGGKIDERPICETCARWRQW